MAIGRPFNRTLIKRANCLIDSSLIRIKRWTGFLSAEYGRIITVRINDRAPFTRGRVIDLKSRRGEPAWLHRPGSGRADRDTGAH